MPPPRSADAPDSVRRSPKGIAAAPSRPPVGPAPASPSRLSRSVPLAGSSRPEFSSASPTAARPNFVRRIAEALQSAPHRDGSRIRLALSPAALGDLRIEVSVSGSRLRVRVRTETEEARDLILAHLDELRRDLGGRGLRVGRFDVDVRARSAEGAAEPGPRLRSHRRQVLDLDA